jgi:DNA-binding transcriptional ArsR family regulator
VHAFIYERDEVDESDKAFALRVCTDNVPMARAKMLMAVTEHYESTSELSERTDMSVGATRHRLNELQALKIVDFMSSKSAGAEEDYDGRANHYRINPEWVKTVEIFKEAMKIGGRADMNTNRRD